MKIKVILILFLYATFLLTPSIVRLIKNSDDTSIFFSFAEEELDTEKEFKAIICFETIKEDFTLNQSYSCEIFSKNSSKHDLISSTIHIPPPKLV